MTAGRKPTPTALKLVKGSPGKRAVNKADTPITLDATGQDWAEVAIEREVQA